MGTAVYLGTPAHGHVNPTLALTVELVKRGERVVYFATEEFRAKIERTGAVYRSYGEALKTESAVFENVFSVAEVALTLAVELLPSIVERVAAEKPDYLLHDALAVWGKLTGRRLGLPAVSTFPYFPTSARKGSGAHRFDLEILRMLAVGFPCVIRCLRLMKRLRREYGRRGGFADIFANLEPLNLVFTSQYFQPYANTFDERYKFVGPQLASRSEFEQFPLESFEGKSVIYISMGTIFNEGTRFYQECFQALGGLNHQIVLSVGDKIDIASLGRIPGNFIVRNRVPQLQILGRADLFITHGGLNSATEGLYYGVPLVVIPQGADQLLVACRVHQLGAGVYLNRKKATPKRLRETVLRVLADASIRRNCITIGDSFRAAGGHERAADEVLRFARRRNGVA